MCKKLIVPDSYNIIRYDATDYNGMSDLEPMEHGQFVLHVDYLRKVKELEEAFNTKFQEISKMVEEAIETIRL